MDPEHLLPGEAHSVALAGADGKLATSPSDARGLAAPTASWAAQGALLGAAASAGVVAVPFLYVPSLLSALMLAPAFGVAAAVGAALGARWKGLARRDLHERTVAGWVVRFASHGAVWGAAMGIVAGVPIGLVHGSLSLVLQLSAVTGLVGAMAGGSTLSALGILHMMDLVRGRWPWRSLAAALVLGPFSFFMFAAMVLFGLHLF